MGIVHFMGSHIVYSSGFWVTCVAVEKYMES